MEFKEDLPVWEKEGVKPPKTKLEEGWQIGDRPPADWFNWLQNKTYRSLLELRQGSSELHDLINTKADEDDVKELIDNIPNVFHDAPQNSVKEDMNPVDFQHGLTLCSQSSTNSFPTIDDYGVTLTARGANASYAQIFITRNGDVWARRSGVINEWNGEWYNAKREIDSKSRSSTIVIANHDSHENSKKSADIVIEKGENASVKINNAIQSLKGTGGEIKLMEGIYNLEYGIVVNVPNVHLTGIPSATILKQSESWKNNPINSSKHILDTNGLKYNDVVNISGLTIDGAKISGSNGFYCHGSSQITNCISNDSGDEGFSCWSSSQITNCISNNAGGRGFFCSDSSQITNCISNDSGDKGFSCLSSSQITNCISNNAGGHGFSCWSSSQITNCISNDSGDNGFRCAGSFKGICSFNTLKGDTLVDNSSAPAIVEYNIIQEEVE